MTLDPAKVGDVAEYVENEARPAIEEIPGSRGVALFTIPDLAVMVMESFWVSGDAMRESEGAVARLRKEAVHRGVGTVSVERHEVASSTRVARPEAGAGVRLTRVDVDPRRVDDAIERYEDTAIPWLTETEGFCSQVLLVHRRTGRGLTETVWRDKQALAAGRSAAAAIRADTVAATDAEIRALEEYHLQFSTVPKFWTPPVR
jgi:heme-degrading monooxygenase HmoA